MVRTIEAHVHGVSLIESRITARNTRHAMELSRARVGTVKIIRKTGSTGTMEMMDPKSVTPIVTLGHSDNEDKL